MPTKKDSHNALPIGYSLHDYSIQAILGESHFAITYFAQEKNLNKKVVIKEYFPSQLATREQNLQVQVNKCDEFEFGLKRFIQESRALMQLKHPNIVQVLNLFESHNTAYQVMVYEEGRSLAEAIKIDGAATEAEIIKILPPLLSALKTIHHAGILHQNINPSNIYLRDKNNSPVLLDFGAARYAFNRQSQFNLKLASGYAPLEQYLRSGEQGEWTDIYALGGVLFYAINGKAPINVIKRVKAIKLQDKPDPLRPAIYEESKRYNKRLLQAIEWALKVVEQNRPQNVTQWNQFICGKRENKNPVKAVLKNESSFRNSKNKPSFFKKLGFSSVTISFKRITIAVFSIVLIVAIFFGTVFYIEKRSVWLQAQQEADERHAILEAQKTEAEKHFIALLQKPPYQVFPVQKTEKSLFPRREIRSLEGHQNGVCVDGCLAFSPDGQLIASGSLDHTIKLWEVKTGNVQRTLKGHQDLVLSIALSANGLLLASSSADSTIKLWEMGTGNLLKTLKEEGKTWIGSIAFSPDGQTLAAEGVNYTVKLWDLKTSSVLKTLSGHKNIINSVTFSPNGEMLASGSADSHIRLWKVNTGKLLYTLKGHKREVLSVAFNHDGKTLASGSAASVIKLWDIQTGKIQKTLNKIHDDRVLSVTFSPNGRILASGSYDDTIKFWDIQQGKILHTLRGHRNNVNTIVFSPDGLMFASGSRDNTIKLYK